MAAPNWQGLVQGGPPRRRSGGGVQTQGGGNAPDPLWRQARRDTLLSMRPTLNDLRNQGQQARQDYSRGAAQTRSSFDDLTHSLAPLGGEYQQEAQGIRQQYGQDLASLGQYLTPTADAGALGDAGGGAGQYGAARNNFGAIGAGGYEMLASQRERNAGYQTSAQRQGGIDAETIQRNYLQNLQDTLAQLRQQRGQQMAGVPSAIRSRLDQLRQQHTQNRLAFMDERLKKRTVDATLQQSGADRALARGTVRNYRRSVNNQHDGHGGHGSGRRRNQNQGNGGSGRRRGGRT